MIIDFDNTLLPAVVNEILLGSRPSINKLSDTKRIEVNLGILDSK